MLKNHSKSNIKLIFTIMQIFVFVVIIVYADQFSRGNEKVYVPSTFVYMDNGVSDSINLDSIAVIELDDKDQGVIQYVIQPGDSLSKIASMFGISVSHLKKINNIGSNSINPGTKLIVSDSGDSVITYELKSKTNSLVFASTYNLNLEDFMSLNSIQDQTDVLPEGQEVFLPINIEKAYELGLLIKPEPKPEPKPSLIKKYTPIINKPSIVKPTKKPNQGTTNNNNDDDTPTKKSSKITSKRVFNKKIKNGFAPGYCTRYVAVKMPNIFPYLDDDSQSRPFGGNANQRYANAKSAGLSVGKTPRAGSIIVYSNLRSSAGHVGIVKSYDSDTGKLQIEDMNYAGKYIVTIRYDNSDNKSIIGYIYP